jgi:hypothetical protein
MLSKCWGDRYSPVEVQDLNQDRPHQLSTKRTLLESIINVTSLIELRI